MAFTNLQLREMAELMRAKENEKRIPLTIRELEDIFHLHSTSAVTYRLDLMVEAGYAERIPKGNGRYATYKSMI